jgi:hypothetical protein
LRERLAALAARDPGRVRFGAREHDYVLHPPLADEAVHSLERRYGVVLPASYRAFLTDVADGGAGPYYGLYRLADPLDEDDAAHDLREEGRRPGFLASPFPHTRACPGRGRGGRTGYPVTGTLVVADAGCGVYARLVVTGPGAGQVWLDDPDWGGLTPGPDFRTWYLTWLDAGR